jgi:hypothetical protein
MSSKLTDEFCNAVNGVSEICENIIDQLGRLQIRGYGTYTKAISTDIGYLMTRTRSMEQKALNYINEEENRKPKLGYTEAV